MSFVLCVFLFSSLASLRVLFFFFWLGVFLGDVIADDDLVVE